MGEGTGGGAVDGMEDELESKPFIFLCSALSSMLRWRCEAELPPPLRPPPPPREPGCRGAAAAHHHREQQQTTKHGPTPTLETHSS
jgi:hypothetical protein